MSKKDCMKGVKQSERSNKKSEYWKHLLDVSERVVGWFILVVGIAFASFQVLAVYDAFKHLGWLKSVGMVCVYICAACSLIVYTFNIICQCRCNYWIKKAAR